MTLKEKLRRLPVPRTPGLPPVPRDEVLVLLRGKMAEILEQPAGAPRPRADPSGGLLPFVPEAREGGTLYRRRLTLAPSHHVGRIPVDAAAIARPELMALLALDASLGSCDLRRALFLDTETTGLGGGSGTCAFLVGMAGFDAQGRLEIEQLLLRSPAEEAVLVDAVRERLDACDLVVTYNGKAFDLPLLASRAAMTRRPALPTRPHLDLVHVARRLHRARLGSCRLVTLESEVLGFERGPDIEGGEIPARYAHFLRTGDESALLAVVEHNTWDLASLAALIGLYGEPYELLHPDDLVGLARTFKRARAFGPAEQAADNALVRGAGPAALRVRGDIAKARGDRARALAEFESFSCEVDDPGVRLELVKLYEHFVKEPGRALEILSRGTGEPEASASKRRARLERKAQKASR
jgi:uncharacterized protein YprB with RNaseH-like and TPR domain